MIFKYLKPGVKDILIPGLIYTTGALSEMLQKQIEKVNKFRPSYCLIYIDNKKLEGHTFIKTISISNNQVKKFYLMILFQIYIVMC